jgi:hypothetical protein
MSKDKPFNDGYICSKHKVGYKKQCPVCAFENEDVKPLVKNFQPWEVIKFSWGTAVKHVKGSWTHVFIGEQEINVENMKIILHDNAIEFI